MRPRILHAEEAGLRRRPELLVHVVSVGLLEDALDTKLLGEHEAVNLVVLVGHAIVFDSQLVGAVVLASGDISHQQSD